MNQVVAYWIMFFLNPLSSLIFAFKNYNFRFSKNIFWAFCTFYGFTFAIGSESQSSDILSYLKDLNFFYNIENLTVNDVITYYIYSREIDVFNLILTSLLSRFTNSQAILTLVYGFIFGYFYSRNIWIVLDRLKIRLNFLNTIILLSLILVVPIWNINGIRMYLAFHVFMYGLIHFIFNYNHKKSFFIFISFLIHFSFIIPIFIFIVYLILGNRINLYFMLFIASIFIVELNLDMFNELVEKLAPDVFIERTLGYRDSNVVEDYNELLSKKRTNWYFVWYDKLLRWILYAALCYFFNEFKKSKFIKLPFWKRFFSLTLLFFITSNLFSGLPSGNRFYIFPVFLALIMILVYLKIMSKYDKKFLFFVELSLPAFVLFIIVSIRLGIYSMSLTTIFGNPLVSLLSIGNNIPLNDIIK